MPNLFIRKDIVLHSGKLSDFKIECDALTDEDLECLAYLVGQKIKFSSVVGVPKGGVRFAKKLQQYAMGSFEGHPFLIVDDVLTTGGSIEEFKKRFGCSNGIIGVVIFSRGKCPEWITPIFQLMI